jgi:hypothetical protein
LRKNVAENSDKAIKRLENYKSVEDIKDLVPETLYKAAYAQSSNDTRKDTVAGLLRSG